MVGAFAAVFFKLSGGAAAAEALLNARVLFFARRRENHPDADMRWSVNIRATRVSELKKILISGLQGDREPARLFRGKTLMIPARGEGLLSLIICALGFVIIKDSPGKKSVPFFFGRRKKFYNDKDGISSYKDF